MNAQCIFSIALLTIVAAPACANAEARPPTVVQGFSGDVYDVIDADLNVKKAIGSCPVAFSGGIFASSPSGTDPCAVAAFTGDAKGFYILIALGQGRDFITSANDVSDVDFAKWGSDVIHVKICLRDKRACNDNSALVYIDLDRANNVYATHKGAVLPATITAETYEKKDTGCYAPAGSKTIPKNYWCSKITVPWKTLELTKNAAHSLDIALSFNSRTLVFGTAEIATQNAFNGIQIAQGLPPTFNARRMSYLAQYEQYSTQTQTPAQTATIRFVPGPIDEVFSLSAPYKPDAAPQRFPPLTAEVFAPLGQKLLVAGTVSQNNSFAQSLQKNVKDRIKLFPKKTGPTVPCDSCITFQSQNHALFDLPAVSDALTLSPSSVGLDEVPLKVAALPDLFGGVALYGASSDGNWKIGALHANPVKGNGSHSRTDSAFAFARTIGSTLIDVQATLVNHPTAATISAPGKFPAAKLSQMNQYSGYWRDENFKSDGTNRTSSDVRPALRYSYDATERALSTFAGVQITQSKYRSNGSARTASLMAGFRGTGARYNTLDGELQAFPSVSGPIASLDLTSANLASPLTPKLELSGYALNFRSRSDEYVAHEAKLSVGVGKDIALFYRWDDGRVSAVLAAVTLIGSDLGDTPYQTAAATIVPGIRTRVYDTRDQGVGFTWNFAGEPDTKGTVSLEWDFDHVAPTCRIGSNGVSSGVACFPPGPSTETVAFSAGVASGPITLAGQYKPAFFDGARGALETNWVFDAAAAYQVDKCDSLIVSASNDATVLAPTAPGNIASSVSAELDSQLRIGGYAPTLIVGTSNNFGSDKASYTGLNPIIGATEKVNLPFRTHTVAFYTALRLGNREYRNTLAPKCGV